MILSDVLRTKTFIWDCGVLE